MKGRKRQIITDTLGLLVCVLVHPAHISDKVAIRWLLRRVPFTCRLDRLVVDKGYDSPAIAALCADWLGIVCEVVQRTGKGFQVQARRWVVAILCLRHDRLAQNSVQEKRGGAPGGAPRRQKL